jgi:hypothetical protein
MNIKILPIVLVLILAQGVYGYFIDEKIDSAGQKYKGYDEILSNITSVGHNNQTYYLVSYTRNLQYSGSVILDAQGNGVIDLTTNRAFFAAQILHQSYPPESTAMYSSLSSHYSEIAKSLPDNLSSDANKIAELMSICASRMGDAIASYNPDAADRYLQTEDQLMSKMSEAEAHLSQINFTSDDKIIIEYQQSLYEIYPQLEAGRKNMNSAVDYMTSNAESKIAGKIRESEIELGMNIVMVLILILIVIGVFLKKKNII